MPVIGDPEAIANLIEDMGASMQDLSLDQMGLTTGLNAGPSISTPMIPSTQVEVMLELKDLPNLF